MTGTRRPRPRGLTLIELLVVVALLGTVLALGAPSLFDYIRLQRLKSISAQFTTDVQFARGQAIAHGQRAFVLFAPLQAPYRCYTVYELKAGGDSRQLYCDCTRGAGSACPNPMAIELRTVALPGGSGLQWVPRSDDRGFGFDPVSGGLLTHRTDLLPQPLASFVIDAELDATRSLRSSVGRAGRPSVCGVGTGLGVQAC